jgi:hypothetical protein
MIDVSDNQVVSTYTMQNISRSIGQELYSTEEVGGRAFFALSRSRARSKKE